MQAEKEPDYKALRAKLIETHKLELKCEFVPLSRSRNADGKWRTLNYKVTLLKNGREIITTDYSMGEAHCPAYKNGAKRENGQNDKYTQDLMIAAECETGLEQECLSWRTSSIRPKGGFGKPHKKVPEPSIEDVLYALLSDSDVIEYSSFEEWAPNVGMDEDSRKGEKIYQECLKAALKIRSHIGDDVMKQLREAFQDY